MCWTLQENWIVWPSTTKYQPLPPSIDPVSSSTNQYCPVLTQHHHISTSTILYWPSTTKYQPVPPHTDPVLTNTNQTYFPFPYIVPSAKNIFLLHIFSPFLSFVDLSWAQLYVSLVLSYLFYCSPSHAHKFKPQEHSALSLTTSHWSSCSCLID